MDSCAVPNSIDMDEVITKGYITKMLSDNYTLLIVFAILFLILVFILLYFIKQCFNAYKMYKQNTLGGSSPPVNIDDEIYPMDPLDNLESSDPLDNLVTTDPNNYRDPEEQKFYKDVDTIYKDYNKEKTNYIKSTYNRDNDDEINEKMIYSKYDSYQKL